MTTKTHTTANRLVGLATAIALASPAWASPVAITNAGFEAQILADNASTTPITGWTNIAGGASAFNPTATQFTNGSAEGNNVASIYEGGDGQGISQILAGPTGLFQADADYVLTVKVGDSKDASFDGYKIQLRADGNVLAEDDNTVAAIDDDFVTATVNYTYNAGLHSALVGQPLEIRLLGKNLGGSPGEVVFDDVQLTLTLVNPVADPGSYSIFVSDSLSLDGSNSQPSDGETITTYEWDLDNDGDFDELVTGATPAAIPYTTLTETYGMVEGLNTIKLKVTDSAAKTSTVDGTVVIKSRTLVHENWQTPLLNNGTQFTTQFTGWTFNAGAYSRRKNSTAELPGVSGETASENQVIELNGDGTYGERNISHNWAATDTYYLRVEASPASWSGSLQRYVRPELRQQNGTLLWQAPQNATTAVPLYNSYMNALTDYPSELTFFFKIDASTFTAGAAGQPLRLRIDGSGQRSLYINNITLVLGPLAADTTPPGPDPLTWDILPTVSNFTTISMRIRSARDPGDLYGVEYYFENITNSTNSGWQNSREWMQTGLAFDTQYTYRVKARDKSPNQNQSINWSTEQSATTLPEDLTAPSPDPLTWQTLPTVADFRSITMTANAATDPSGVEYYFENVTNSTNSGWINARSWTQKDLAPNTLYTYRVRARDKSLAQNVSTTWSTQESATTPAEPAGTLYITRFQDPLIPTNTGNPNLGNWVFGGGDANSIKMRWASSGDGMRTDTDIATTNQAIQFEWAERWMEYDIPHNWSSTDTFTLTINAAPQAWSGTSQRYVRPSLRQQNGTVLWAPGENMSGPEKTAVPLSSAVVGSSYQDDPNLSFTYTIPASAFSAGTEGQPIRIRIGQSGARGLYIDNVHLSVTSSSGGSPEIAVEQDAVDIPNTSGSKDFGTATIGTDNDLVFTILNTGDADLNLTGSPIVDISGDPDFTVHVQPSTNPVPDGDSTTFTVRFNPQASGARSATVSIDNDDSDEDPFTFTVNGTGQTASSGYAAWATGNEPFDGDANGDGVQDGLAFLLGAATPETNALGLLPTVSESDGDLVLSFNCLPVAARGGASLHVVHSSDLDGWTATADEVPDDTNAVPDNDVTFVVGEGPVGPPALNSVTATIDSAAAEGGKLFGGLKATE